MQLVQNTEYRPQEKRAVQNENQARKLENYLHVQLILE